MKNLIIFTISALALSNFVTSVLANEAVAINQDNASNVSQITPFNLVNNSYQGRFINQGIPSNISLLSGIRSNRIKAEDLVKGAIASGRLAEDALNNPKYLHSVQFLLNNLSRH